MKRLTYFCAMSNHDLPTYAIVELLIRLSEYNTAIGNYKDHMVHENGVMVKTSTGHINFGQELLMQQFNQPELITRASLMDIAAQFKKSVQ